jgi:hypothetical protein
LRNEYILSHTALDPALLAGTKQPPTGWINERLKQLGETWNVERPPLKVRRWEIMPYAIGKKLTARIHIVNPTEELRNFMVVFNRGMAPDYVDDYDARKSLEDTLWTQVETVAKTAHATMTLPIGDTDVSFPVESQNTLTSQDIDKLNNGFAFYLMALIVLDTGQRLESCIRVTANEPLGAYGYCIEHN